NQRQAAYDLFISFLQKRQVKGIDLQKELPVLLDYGHNLGVFQNPHTVHEITEWRKFGEKLWEATIEENKTAKKMGKPWKIVFNELLQQQAEVKAAEQASVAYDKNKSYGICSDCPLPPATPTVILPPTSAPASGSNSPPTCAVTAPLTLSARPPPSNEPIPGAENALAGAIARERREAWSALAREVMNSGDREAMEAVKEIACPVVFTPLAGGGFQATITALDWKLLSQLRATVSQFGVTGEPTKQMLDYIWGTQILLPADSRSIAKLILTEHQQLLFGAYWQQLCQECVNVQRQPGDPLFGIILDELLGAGPFSRTEAQALLAPEKCRQSMNLARMAIDRIREPGGIPSYMGIKQGRDEPFGSFIDRTANAIECAGVPDYIKGALLKQCALQNCSQATRSVLNTLGANWSIEEALERMANVPIGSKAMLREAIKEIGVGIQKQVENSQKQVENSQTQIMAALAPLQAAVTNAPRSPSTGRFKCYRCGGNGHTRAACHAVTVWCHHCRSDTHNTGACKRRSGNARPSTNNSCAQTQIAAVNATSAPPSNQPQAGASAWTWNPQ
ncbi:GAK8 protein, partial [Passerina amoena]|nr:GAK8 protein [Passerina amoena]